MQTHFGPDPFGGKGFLLVNQPDYRLWICETEPGVYQTCAEELVDPILEANARLRAANAGKRWGDGQIVASIPLDKYYQEIVPLKKAGDQAGIKRWLNDPDNHKLRTFEGKI